MFRSLIFFSYEDVMIKYYFVTFFLFLEKILSSLHLNLFFLLGLETTKLLNF